MTQMAAPAPNTRERVEEYLLSALCQDGFPPEGRAFAIRRLSRYRFAHAPHQAVFQALATLPTTDPKRIREFLPQRLNNLGFPDLPWEVFFETRAFDGAHLAAQLDSLFD
jgi:hypothetical protein